MPLILPQKKIISLESLRWAYSACIVGLFSSRVNEFAADGRRFMLRVEPGDAEATMNMITNWEKVALENK